MLIHTVLIIAILFRRKEPWIDIELDQEIAEWLDSSTAR